MFRPLLISMFLTSTALADTWTVDDDGKADFDNIQAAVDAASDGDEIIVMPGTYTSAAGEVVDMLGKAVWLHSSKGEQVTIIDGEGTRRGIYCNNQEPSNTIIEGFTITNGYADNNSGGGGMLNDDNSNPTLTNCTFTNNTAGAGGGMYTNESSPTLTNCTFTNNTSNSGGGMRNFQSSPTLTNCTFTGNICFTRGGGMANWYGSFPTVTGCTFTDNTGFESGGGMYNNYDSTPTLTDTTVCGNTNDQIIGYWIDNGGNTVADECPGIVGACCTNDGCVVSEEEDCITFLGQWLGEDTTCDDDSCPTSCPGDINGDSQVNVNDLMILIAYWGACP
jgi:hypothetical protein